MGGAVGIAINKHVGRKWNDSLGTAVGIGAAAGAIAGGIAGAIKGGASVADVGAKKIVLTKDGVKIVTIPKPVPHTDFEWIYSFVQKVPGITSMELTGAIF